MTTVTVPATTGDPDQGTPAATVTVVVATAEDTPDREHPDREAAPLTEDTVTLREASAATGASVSAMRKAIRAGRLRSTVVEGPNGPEHRVTLTAVREAMPKATAPRHDGPEEQAVDAHVVDDDALPADRGHDDEDLARLLERVVAYSQEAGERAARAEAERDLLRGELERTRRELAGVRDELLALPAGPAPTVTEPSTPGRESEVPEGMVMVRRRWWHRRDHDRG